MKILSFDQSTTCSGWCYQVDGQYINSGAIAKEGKDTDKRVTEMGLSICKKIKEFQPSLVVFEDIQNQNSVKTVIHLARLQGCIMLYCASKKIEFKILHPSEWRKQLQFKQGSKVKRDELKQQSRDYVKNILGLSVKSEDENEAICIGVAANKLYNTK